MSSLRKTPFSGTVTWLGVVRDSEIDLRAERAEVLALSFAGQQGECHAGLTRSSCSRVLDLYPRNTIIRNVRQLSILSEEEIDAIASELGAASVHPQSLGASMVVRGIPDLSHLPPNSRLMTDSGATVTIDMENRPCMFTGKVVHEDNPIIGHWNKFKPAASGRRGVTAWVEREGEVRVGDRVTLFVPDQRPWSCYESRELMHFDMNRPKIGTSSSGMSDITARLVKMLIAGMIFAVVMISCRL